MRAAIAGVLVLPLAASCGNGGVDLRMSRDGLRALPAIVSNANALTAGDPLPFDSVLRQFFSLQCHERSGPPDYCPRGVAPDESNAFTAQALLGMLYAGDREALDVFRDGYQSCSAGDGARKLAATRASFASKDGGDGAKYLLDQFQAIDCVGHRLSPSMRYFAYSKQAAKRIAIVTRKHDTLSTAGADQSDVYQLYVSQDAAGASRVFAFNHAGIGGGATDYGQRAVLLVNLQTRRFLVKYRNAYSVGTDARGDNVLTAAGTGGISPAGAYEPGVYFVRTSGSGAPTLSLCVDNATRLLVAESSCAVERSAWSGAADAAAYLGLTQGEAADLAPFSALFAAGPTATDLAESDAPAGAADAVNVPDVIQ